MPIVLHGLCVGFQEGKSYPLILPAIVLLGFIGFYTLEIAAPYLSRLSIPYPDVLLRTEPAGKPLFQEHQALEDPALSREEQACCGRKRPGQ